MTKVKQRNEKANEKTTRFITIVFLTILVFLGIYVAYIWIDTESVITDLRSITHEAPNSRDVADPYWALIPKVDDNGEIYRRTIDVYRRFTWVVENKGWIEVGFNIESRASSGEMIQNTANWIIEIEKVSESWEVVDIRNTP